MPRTQILCKNSVAVRFEPANTTRPPNSTRENH